MWRLEALSVLAAVAAAQDFSGTCTPQGEYLNVSETPNTTTTTIQVNEFGWNIDPQCTERACDPSDHWVICNETYFGFGPRNDKDSFKVDGLDAICGETEGSYGKPINVGEQCSQYSMYWTIDETRRVVYPIFLYLFGVVYTFFGIAIICDEFFVPSLERICAKFKISPDVAGATLMAAGGSAPELASNFVGTFNASPVGFGTIVGSAVFNVLFVIGCCAFASPGDLELDWFPLFRDSVYYVVCLLILVVFFGYLTPGKIFWYEDVCLLMLYIGYVVLMSQNNRLQAWAEKITKKCQKGGTKPAGKEAMVHPVEVENKKPQGFVEEDEPPKTEAEKTATLEKAPTESAPHAQGSFGANGDDDEDDDPYTIEWPTLESADLEGKKCASCQLCGARFFFILTIPLAAAFVLTVPDVRREKAPLCGVSKCCVVNWPELWLPGFAVSIIWIGMLSYLMVWWAEVLGFVSSVPSAIVGLTLLAAGTSIPDLLSSVAVARKGEGNMAVSSSIGSNIFDILVGLPLPWLTVGIINGIVSWGSCYSCNVYEPRDGECVLPPASKDNHFCFSVNVEAGSLMFSVLLLIGMIIAVIGIVHCSKWKMTTGLGIAMIVLYIVFVIQNVLRDCTVSPLTARWFLWLDMPVYNYCQGV